MYRKGSVLLPVLTGLFIISLLAAAGVFYFYQQEYAQNIQLKAKITELEDLQRSTASKLDESKKTATDLALQLQEAKGKIESLTGELAAEKSAHAETSNKLEQIKTDLSKQKSSREDLENRLNQVQVEGKQIKEQLKITQQQKIDLEEKIKNLEAGAGGVELGKVVVNPELSAPANDSGQAQAGMENTKNNAADARRLRAAANQPSALANALEGKVMVVNKEFNFVVINLGSKDKVNVGDEFTVSRAGKPLAEIKIEKVHEVMSAAGFAPELKDLIKENDKVTQKLK